MSHENWSLYFIDLFTNNSTRQQEGNKYNLDFFLKKKIGACVFWAPYFSKSFGGKIFNS